MEGAAHKQLTALLMYQWIVYVPIIHTHITHLEGTGLGSLALDLGQCAEAARHDAPLAEQQVRDRRHLRFVLWAT